MRLLRILETLFSGNALICFRVSVVPPIAAFALGCDRSGDSNPEATCAGCEAWTRVQRPPPCADLA